MPRNKKKKDESSTLAQDRKYIENLFKEICEDDSPSTLELKYEEKKIQSLLSSLKSTATSDLSAKKTITMRQKRLELAKKNEIDRAQESIEEGYNSIKAPKTSFTKDPNTYPLEALKHNSPQIMKALIERDFLGVDLTHVPIIYLSLLLTMSSNNVSNEIILMLIELGKVNLDTTNDSTLYHVNPFNKPTGYTALHQAILFKNKIIIDALIKAGANMNIHGNFDGTTPLHLTVNTNAEGVRLFDAEIAKHLILSGADINAQVERKGKPMDKKSIGYTFLHLVCQDVINSSGDILDFILGREDLDINKKAANGATALTLAINNQNFAAAKKLINNGADLGLLDGKNLAAENINSIILLLASEDSRAKELVQNKKISKNCAIVKDFIANTDDLSSASNYFKLSKIPALHFAVVASNIEMIEDLIFKGVNIDAKTDNGNTALHLALRYSGKQYSKISNLLLTHGAQTSIANNENLLPIDNAICFNKDYEIISNLLEKPHKNISIKTFATILNKHDSKMIDFLHLKMNQLKLTGDIQILLAALVVIMADDCQDMKLLQKFIMENKNSIKLLTENNYGLVYACKYENEQAVQNLINVGANLDHLYINNENILHLAVYGDKDNIVKVLLKNMAASAIYKRDNCGLSSIELAAAFGRDKILKLFIELLTKEKHNIEKNKDLLSPSSWEYKLLDSVSVGISQILESSYAYAEFGGYESTIGILQKELGIVRDATSSSEDYYDEDIVPTIEQEDKYISLQKQMHSFHQVRKLISSKESDKIVTEQWIVKGKQYVTDTNVVRVEEENKNHCYFAIDDNLAHEIEAKHGTEILDKFKLALEQGFAKTYGKSGTKKLQNALYELKIYSNTCSDLRLYTTKKYINHNKKEIIIFTNQANHAEIKKLASKSLITRELCDEISLSDSLCSINFSEISSEEKLFNPVPKQEVDITGVDIEN